VGSGELNQCMVEASLTAVAESIDLEANEIKATIKSGIKSGLQKPRQAPKNTYQKTDSQVEDYMRKGGSVKLLCAADIKPEPISWTWHGWIAGGKVHIIAGPAGHGKSTVAFSLGATITIGGLWPDGTKADVGEIVIWSGEDHAADTIVPRLIACGADLRRVHIIRGVFEGKKKRSFDPAKDIALLRESIAERPVKMLIIDPIVSAVSGDSHKNAEVRRALQPVVDLAAETGCAVYGITHFTKGTAGRDPVDRVTGSLAFGALTRIVTVALKMPEEGSHPPGSRLFARAKSNIGPDGGGFYYRLEEREISDCPGLFNTCVTWGESVDGSARYLLSQAETDDESQSILGEAVAWLSDTLKYGPVAAGDIHREAQKQGFSRTTLWRAKDRLGVKATKHGFGKGASWGWSLPEESTKNPIQLGLDSSDKNNTQHIDICKESTKNPTTGFFGGDGTFKQSKESTEESQGRILHNETINTVGYSDLAREESKSPGCGPFGNGVNPSAGTDDAQEKPAWEF
jgi:putative DNA primase/helicase